MRIKANGVDYFVMVQGEGPPLLLLHGFTGSHHTWSSFIAQWSRRYKVIALDIIGHGQTECPQVDTLYTMSEAAKSINAILDELGMDKVNVLGYSMGGRLALYFAVHYSHRVSGLLLESASPGLALKEERDARIQKDNALAQKIIDKGVEAFVNEWEKIPLFSTQEHLTQTVKEAVRKERLQHHPIGLANSLRGMGTGRQPSLWEALKDLEQPVLLVVGEKDRKFLNIAQEMKQRLPMSFLIIVQQAGHALHVEVAEKFDKIVYDDFYRMIEHHERRMLDGN
ncbi:putative 2-succinyl-6-hydroxy-2,4-cyclohexadiene-1-carboxylate synthase [Pullulanibacillus camelliae]|uniref:Putative 2-succinyl-6-hydroxy-2,4-cyclohexadiene-1-carboxylate synthase n=1 Tax=Pullulanibacillus camelliae TaxID=1707096 RepID=A0A8J3E027_9BACL|nr:2-succinyl-6-hydroxy-2,4-cyclohexadiene-1-carboxylate synthase [Pullulanibacillus camelliae]GGE49993.1 putative 2-succinyl-6-hydroxy-2,4-cyclohexadiene-1-carboxylate synthase [Pullulanibacillus camelliae]